MNPGLAVDECRDGLAELDPLQLLVGPWKVPNVNAAARRRTLEAGGEAIAVRGETAGPVLKPGRLLRACEQGRRVEAGRIPQPQQGSVCNQDATAAWCGNVVAAAEPSSLRVAEIIDRLAG